MRDRKVEGSHRLWGEMKRLVWDRLREQLQGDVKVRRLESRDRDSEKTSAAIT